ncbi:MAG: efflux RND transporter periplasmic adaptor subunit [Clostridiales bacterium]|nr:efflux RND transporter periplasmic adaptor subunit [Clostridiales bacterium]
MKKKVKIALIICAALAVTSAAAWAVARPPAVECLVLESSVLENAFSEIGEVIPEAEMDIYTKTGGKLLDVRIAEGSAVQKGDLLFAFDSTGRTLELDTQKKAFESERAGAQTRLDQALMEEKRQHEELESAKSIHESGGLSDQQLNNQQISYDKAVKDRELVSTQIKYLESQIQAVGSEIDTRSRENQSETEVFADRPGIIRDLTVKEGHVIPPGGKLCSLYQPNQLRVDCYILVENTEGVKTGDEVDVTLRLRDEDKKFKGTIGNIVHGAVDRVSKVGLTEKRIKIEIKVDEGGWEDVGPYWPVEVRFVTARSSGCLIAPKTALFEDAEGVFKVWAVQDGKLVAVEVEKGIQTPSQTEIRGDLEPGDVIVKNTRTMNVTPGKSVRVII